MDKISIPLWKNTGRESGRTFLAGAIKLLGLKVMVFENTKKEKPNQPDFNLVITRDIYTRDENQTDRFFGGKMEHQDDGDVPF